MTSLPDEVVLAKEYKTIEDIARKVVEKTALAQEKSIEELEEVPIQAIDEVEMPKAIQNDKEISQDSWNKMREMINTEVQLILDQN